MALPLCHSSKPQSQMPRQAYANHAMSPPQVGFYFKVEPPTVLFLYVWCLLWCMLSVFRCDAGCCIHLWGLNHWGLHHCSHLEFINGKPMCNLMMVISSHQLFTEWLPSSTALSRGAFCYSLSCPSSHSNYMVGHTALGSLAESTSSLHLPCMVGGLLFQV